MSFQKHIDHLECIGNLNDLYDFHLRDMLLRGQMEDKIELNSTEKLYLYSLGMEPAVMGLVVPGREDMIVSIFPFIRDGEKLRLKIIEIKEWGNEFEAIIVAETQDEEHTISFFDTKYYKNKGKYKIGEFYTFIVSALAYDIEILKDEDKSFSYEGQAAVRWRAMTGQAPEYDENGQVKPCVFDMSKMVAFIPKDDENVEIQSPISSVEKVWLWQINLYKFKILLFNDPTDICVNLYAKESFFDKIPTNNDSLRAVIWLQGFLEEDKNKEVEFIKLICDEYETKSKINNENDYSFANWGRFLYKLAELKDDKKEKEKLFESACEKYEKATIINDKNDGAFTSWGTTLFYLARIKQDESIYKQAFEKWLKSYEINSKNSFNVSYGYALFGDKENALKYLEEALKNKRLDYDFYVLNDTDEVWQKYFSDKDFLDLIEKYK